MTKEKKKRRRLKIVFTITAICTIFSLFTISCFAFQSGYSPTAYISPEGVVTSPLVNLSGLNFPSVGSSGTMYNKTVPFADRYNLKGTVYEPIAPEFGPFLNPDGAPQTIFSYEVYQDFEPPNTYYDGDYPIGDGNETVSANFYEFSHYRNTFDTNILMTATDLVVTTCEANPIYRGASHYSDLRYLYTYYTFEDGYYFVDDLIGDFPLLSIIGYGMPNTAMYIAGNLVYHVNGEGTYRYNTLMDEEEPYFAEFENSITINIGSFDIPCTNLFYNPLSPFADYMTRQKNIYGEALSPVVFLSDFTVLVGAEPTDLGNKPDVLVSNNSLYRTRVIQTSLRAVSGTEDRDFTSWGEVPSQVARGDWYNDTIFAEIPSVGEFLGTAVGGFFSLEILPNIKLGSVLVVCLSVGFIVAILKYFAGG